MSHGGNVHKIAAGLGLKESDVMDFSASINPLGMPRAVKKAVADGMKDALHYPDPDNTELTRAIAARYGLAEDRVLCGNGSTELIYLIPRVLSPGRVLIANPTFSEYERASALSGAETVPFPLDKARGFLPDVGAMAGAMKSADMAFLCNPANPSGGALGRTGVLKLISAARRERCLLVVDEAFMDFCPEHSVLDVRSPWLVVMRSLTKFYGLAGLRSGFCTGPAPLIKKLKQHKEPWSVNVLAQRASVAAISDEDFGRRTRRYVRREKNFLERAFKSMALDFFPSDANYYLIHSSEAPSIVAGLLSRSIAVRECASFRGLGRNYIRVAVRTRKENELLVKGLSEILGGGGEPWRS